MDAGAPNSTSATENAPIRTPATRAGRAKASHDGTFVETRNRERCWPTSVASRERNKGSLLSASMPRSIGLQVDQEARRVRTGAAGREAVISLVLFFGQIEIAVIGNALEHARDAGAAHALLARQRHLHARLGQRRRRCLGRRHYDGPTRAPQMDLERLVPRVV